MVSENLDKEYYKKCYETEKNIFAWQMREMLARKSSLLIWGNNYLFQSNNEKISSTFKKVEFLNNLSQMLPYIERNCSLYGRALITINKTRGDEFMLNVAEPYYFNGVGKAFVQPQLAVIWQRYYVDNMHFLVESTYTTTKVVNRVYQKDDNDKEKLLVLGAESEILEKLQIEKEWVHNFGFVPVVEFTNIPYISQNFNNSTYIRLTDWFPAFQFEELAYQAKKNLAKEFFYCHSRIGVENASQNLIDSLKAMGDGVADNDIIINTDVGANVHFIPGNGDFTKYTSSFDNIMDFYFKFAGLSRFSEGGGAQKTVAETSSIRSAMIENVKQKISLRENQVNDLLRKVFACYGVIKDYWEFNKDEEFDFRINGNILKDETSWIDNQLKLIDNGIITPVDLIQDIFNISKQDAEKKFQSNRDWLEENNIKALELGDDENEFSENDDSGFDRTTGEHQALSKKGES